MTLKFNSALMLATLALISPVALTGRVYAQESPTVEPPQEASIGPLDEPTGTPRSAGTTPSVATPSVATPSVTTPSVEPAAVTPPAAGTGTATVAPTAEPANNNTPSVAFKCIPQDSGFATVVSTSDRNIPIITWNSPNFSPEFSPEKRCQKVSEKFQTAINKYGAGNLLLTTGRVSGQGVICLVNGGLLGCNRDNVLLTLSGENAKDPGVALAKLLNISTTGSGSPIQERQGKQVVPLSNLIARALQATNTQPASTQAVPQQPVRQQPVRQQPGRLF